MHDSKCETTTFVDESRGVQAWCLTCSAPVGPEHGVRDGLTNIPALLTAMNERAGHENDPAAHPADTGRVNW